MPSSTFCPRRAWTCPSTRAAGHSECASGAVSAQDGEALLEIGRPEWEGLPSTCAFDWRPTPRLVVSAEYALTARLIGDRCGEAMWRLRPSLWVPSWPLASAGRLAGSRVDEHSAVSTIHPPSLATCPSRRSIVAALCALGGSDRQLRGP